ncbi:MAG: ABC transporter ATP-binding protein [Phycisphaerae bacterium]|nr:ABC transporter ATP-binding protein [Phycisphaerae bacterium]
MSAATLATAPVAIECRAITKEFVNGDMVTPVLRGVDLEFPAGEMGFLVGPSGCGKTTLISIIAGILTPTDGEVTVFGRDIQHLSAGQKTRFRRENVGFIFQQYNLLPALSAVENAAIPLIAAGLPYREATAAAAELLSRLDMGDHLKKQPRQLSGGQQQRVAVARALVHQPKLVVCDEPTAALDAHTGHRVLELLRAIALSPDRAVIVVTHDNRIFEFADRIAHMDDGRILDIERNGHQRIPGASGATHTATARHGGSHHV